jgi:hypothetical protein
LGATEDKEGRSVRKPHDGGGLPGPAPGSRYPEWHERDEEAFDSVDRATALVRRMLAVTIPVGIGLLALLPLLGATPVLALPVAIVGALLAGLLVERLAVRPRVRRGASAALPPALRRVLLGLAAFEVALIVVAGFTAA